MVQDRKSMKRKHTTFEAKSSKEEGSYTWDCGGRASAGVSPLQVLQNDQQEKVTVYVLGAFHWEKHGKADFISALKKVDVEGKMSRQSGYNCSQPNKPCWKEKKKKKSGSLSLFSFQRYQKKCGFS